MVHLTSSSSTSNSSVEFGGNVVPLSVAAVAEVRRDDESALAADLHAGHALVPALDDSAGAERKGERLAVVHAAVELLALGLAAVGGQPAGVVDRDLVAGLGRGAVADFRVDVFQARIWWSRPCPPACRPPRWTPGRRTPAQVWGPREGQLVVRRVGHQDDAQDAQAHDGDKRNPEKLLHAFFPFGERVEADVSRSCFHTRFAAGMRRPSFKGRRPVAEKSSAARTQADGDDEAADQPARQPPADDGPVVAAERRKPRPSPRRKTK